MGVLPEPENREIWDDAAAEEGMLVRFMRMSAEAKLQWLEEANRFLYAVAPPRARELWGRFRRQEI